MSSSKLTGADPGFFQSGGCNFENSRQTYPRPREWGRVGRVRVMFESVDFLHLDFRGI